MEEGILFILRKMKKIVFLSRYQDKPTRGAEVFVQELSSRLKKHFDVQILSGRDSDSLAKLLSLSPNLVIPINGRSQALKASLGRFIGGYKLLITGHSGRGRDDIWNIVVGKPEVFIALTESTKIWAKKYSWGSKVIKIPNGVDLDNFNPKGKEGSINLPKPIILSVGALTWYKNHIQAIAAVAKLKKGSLLIVGEGPEKERLEKEGKEKLGGRFLVTGYDYKDMPKIYISCDLFTLPSWDREAFGIVYLEALASGLPVVAPDDLSRREIIGEAGIFVDTSNDSLYSESISEVLTKDWGDKPRKQAEKFSWDIISDKYKDVIEEILK